jgi:hypothetical protein
MQLRFWIALCSILIAIGFAVGFATAQFLHAQSATATIPGFIVSIAPIAGAGVASLGLFQAWNRSRKEEERIPVLEFGGFFFTEGTTILVPPLAGWIATTYILLVRRTNRGIGRAEQCDGFVSVAFTTLKLIIDVVESFSTIRLLLLGNADRRAAISGAYSNNLRPATSISHIKFHAATLSLKGACGLRAISAIISCL